MAMPSANSEATVPEPMSAPRSARRRKPDPKKEATNLATGGQATFRLLLAPQGQPMYRLDGRTIVSDPAVSPDGSRIAVVVVTIDVDADAYRRRIWMIDGEARPFTAGDGDTHPRWSPDGSRLAYFRQTDNGAQVAVIPAGGGEGGVITSFPLGVDRLDPAGPAWSSDGSVLAVVGIAWTDADLDDAERARRPRRITTRDYRFDGRGWTHDRRRQVYLCDPTGAAQPRRLTSWDHDEAGPAWSPEGHRLAFLADSSPRPGLEPGTEIWEAEPEGQPVRLADRGLWSVVGYRPDGVAHAVGFPGTAIPDVAGLWRFDDPPVDLTAILDRSVSSLVGGPPPLVWDGETAHVAHEDAGSLGIAEVLPDGTVTHRLRGRSVVTGYSRAGGTSAVTVSEPTVAGRLDVTTGDDGTVSYFGEAEGIEPEHFTVRSEEVDLDVWVYLPEGGEAVPLLLNIHGGPASQYGWGYLDEFQAYAAAGFGVVATNPRGSSGRGREFLRAVVGEGWGAVDLADIDAVVEAALDRYPLRLDGDRLGIMGGSYGGFLTAWALAHQDRWRSAVVERALLSWPSFAGTSDIGAYFGGAYLGSDAWEMWWEKSPLRLAHRITTPTLIVHSEEDWRCPVEQAEQLFSALVRNGTETEMLRFPGEGHELTRRGSPRHRQERLEAIIAWHGRHLA